MDYGLCVVGDASDFNGNLVVTQYIHLLQPARIQCLWWVMQVILTKEILRWLDIFRDEE
jgi:hypothetical protein